MPAVITLLEPDITFHADTGGRASPRPQAPTALAIDLAPGTTCDVRPGRAAGLAAKLQITPRVTRRAHRPAPRATRATSIQDVTKIFPAEHLDDGLHHAFDPAAPGSGITGSDLALLPGWALGGL